MPKPRCCRHDNSLLATSDCGCAAAAAAAGGAVILPPQRISGANMDATGVNQTCNCLWHRIGWTPYPECRSRAAPRLAKPRINYITAKGHAAWSPEAMKGHCSARCGGAAAPECLDPHAFPATTPIHALQRWCYTTCFPDLAVQRSPLLRHALQRERSKSAVQWRRSQAAAGAAHEARGLEGVKPLHSPCGLAAARLLFATSG